MAIDPLMVVALRLPFAEQVQFFRRKLALPSERWDTIRQAAHDRAFIVAGAQKADLLDDLKQAVDKAIAEGTTLDTFRRDFRDIVRRHGWTGWTGEGSAAGEAWRTRIIYQTNLRSSHAAGRWAQLTDPDLLRTRPFWRYVHSDNTLTPRPHHKAWGDARLTLRHDHPFWRTHYPPNGWGCACRVTAVRAPQAGDATEPPTGWQTRDSKGRLPGIDRGWDYAPGANAATPLRELIEQKLLKLDAPIGAAMWEQLAPALAMERELAWWHTLDDWLADTYPRGKTAIVGALKPDTLAWLAANGKPLPATAEIAVRDNLPKGVKQQRHEAAQDGLTPDEWRALPRLLQHAAAIYFDERSGKLVFVTDGGGPTKAVLEFDPRKLKGAMNMIETIFRVDATSIAANVKGRLWSIVEISGNRVGVEPT